MLFIIQHNVTDVGSVLRYAHSMSGRSQRPDLQAWHASKIARIALLVPRTAWEMLSWSRTMDVAASGTRLHDS